jgi:hypothetical protein
MASQNFVAKIAKSGNSSAPPPLKRAFERIY